SEKIRFLMITGVSKFTKMSVFSALSSLVDISFKDDYATMLGFTEDELDKFFGEHLRAHARTMQLDYATYRQELKRMYNGYRFGKFTETRVYNPVSVSMTLFNNEPRFIGYWSTTGKSSFLMNFLKREEYLKLNIGGDIKVDDNAFDVSDLHRLSPVGMLFQTGYLTIKGCNDGIYTLRIPNEEVRRDLSLITAGAIAKRDWRWAEAIGVHLRCREWDEFFQGLEALYAGLVYGSKEKRVHENSYTRNLCFLLWGQGFQVKQEDQQSAGRADLVADHPCGTYVFEFKVGKPASKALGQARARKYAAPYRAAGKPVWLIGLSFDRSTRRLVGHKWQEVKC
ncbi:MAG: AAA family ATPase, partial [Planctomycetes bacterium]|nr:AAA family ATPase [Planctomycetota bacterium]